MRLAVALVSLSFVLCAAGSARAQEPKDLDVAFNEAVDAVLKGNGEAAAAGFGDLVDNRWAELNPRGRHGATTLLMFALLLDDRDAKACARGATLYGVMPEVFYPLGKEGAPEAVPRSPS